MALSPNSPDYIGEVRGVINDLRQNYLTKQQLFQQQQQAAAQIGLGYAQLSAQRDNQARQAELDGQRIELEGVKNQRDLENITYNRARQAGADRLEADKLEIYQEERRQKINEIDKKNQEEAESGRLFSYVRNAKSSGDPDQIAMAEAALENSSLSALTKMAMLDRIDIAEERKRKVDELIVNKQKQPQVNNILSLAANLPTSNTTIEEAQAALTKYSTDFQNIGTSDPVANNRFNSIISQKQTELIKLRDDAVSQAVSQLNLDGAQKNVFTKDYPGSVGEAFQKRYDDITKGIPVADRVYNPNTFTALQGLAADMQEVVSQRAVDEQKVRFIIAQENLVKKNPALGVETIDQATGEKRTTFASPMPSMVLTRNDLDSRTGRPTKQKLKEISDYQNLLDKTLSGDYNALQMMIGRSISQSPAVKKSNLPFIPNDPYSTAVQAPVAPSGTAVVKTATPAGVIPISAIPSDEEIFKMAEDPKTADMIVPGAGKKRTYRETAKYLNSLNPKNVATPNSY
jgi:hypothetical protein